MKHGPGESWVIRSGILEQLNIPLNKKRRPLALEFIPHLERRLSEGTIPILDSTSLIFSFEG